MDVKNRFVGFLKQAKKRVSDWYFRRNANFLTAIAFSKTVWD